MIEAPQKVVNGLRVAVTSLTAPDSTQVETETALLFLEKFLAGETAGDAMLDTRRILLAQNNPLGLVYTLYAAAHLKLVTV